MQNLFFKFKKMEPPAPYYFTTCGLRCTICSSVRQVYRSLSNVSRRWTRISYRLGILLSIHFFMIICHTIFIQLFSFPHFSNWSNRQILSIGKSSTYRVAQPQFGSCQFDRLVVFFLLLELGYSDQCCRQEGGCGRNIFQVLAVCVVIDIGPRACGRFDCF